MIERRVQDSIEESVGPSGYSDIESERIEVIITGEFRDYVEKITIGKLSRHNFISTLRLEKITFYCVMVCYVATMDNFAMFNFAVVRYGAFIYFPFVMSMFCVGFPMTCLELALGQYTHASVLVIFDRIAPIAVGLFLT
ncbi:unnamed protein product [Angiostrongylus costaricensis]|uniref:Aa_trans domain-containing protein n=1 Tax=Angiostrongylus costaricensis TaxID=334426 RepID=A0A0R3PQP0_ANGCS|nr:unnamed protein product [Angiostrongylus costaricensis]